MEDYFSINPSIDLIKELIIERRKRQNISGLKNLYVFYAGDVLEIIFYIKTTPIVFRGICLGTRKTFLSKDYQIILRNSLSGCIVELIASFYYNYLFTMRILDYRRKAHKYGRAKLFYLRKRVYTSSRV